MNLILALPSSLFIQGIYSGLIGTISTCVVKSSQLITKIYKHKNVDVIRILKKTDIEYKLLLVETVMNNIKNKYKTDAVIENKHHIILNQYIKHEDYTRKREPLELCIESLNEIIKEIHLILNEINEKINYHNSKWFVNWRKLNINKQIDLLEINTAILNERFNDLLRIAPFL